MSYWPRNPDPKPIYFVHIPKTAGISIQRWFKQRYGKFEKSMHADVRHDHLSQIARTMPGFCVVRNPFDLVYSWYRYKRQMLDEPRHYDKLELDAWNKGFDFWMENYFTKINYSNDKYLKGNLNPIGPSKTQLDYITDNGRVVVKYHCRFESLSNDIRKVNNIVGGTAGVPHENKTILQKDYRSAYSSQSKKIVEQAYKKDLEFWGYDF